MHTGETQAAGTGTAPPLVEVDGLVKHYGKFCALDHVSFSLPAGAVTGLLGPNGAGKTTLLKTLLGFLPSTAGSIRMLGHSLREAPLQARQRVGFMPENDAAFPGATGLEAVVLAGRVSGMPKEAAFSRAYEVLDYLGMDEVRHRPVAGYSVGLKQKVKLAQAVVHGPPLLFLDEPLSGLDPTSRDEMMSLLAGIAGRGVTLVLSSHVLHDVETLCSSVLMLDRGRLVFDGPIRDLSRARAGWYRIRIRGDAQAFKAALLARTVPFEEGPAGLAVQLGDSARAAWEAAAGARCQVRELEPVRDTLETAFLRLLGKGS